MARQRITILGSTGSIGVNTLAVLSRHPERYQVIALGAHRNFKRLAKQCQQHHARYAVISDESQAAQLQSELDRLHCNAEVLAGSSALCDVARMAETDVVMAAIVGASGA